MKLINWLIVGIGILGLIGVRFVENDFFYDPFLAYFHTADKNIEIPGFEWSRLIIHHLFRFSLNLICSLLVIHFMFRNKLWTVQALALISIVFIITFPIYLYCIHTKFQIGYLFSFYTRRFVIQPLILLLIIPMFYYRKSIEKN